jgi:hypothetical protein
MPHGYGACEIEFGAGCWIDRNSARRLGALAHEAAVALSFHTALAGCSCSTSTTPTGEERQAG